MRRCPKIAYSILCSLLTTAVHADPAQMMLDGYRNEAKAASSAFTDFSAERGRGFFAKMHPSKTGEISCATCHSSDPRKVGRTRANKDIEPLAPSVNAKRFTDQAKVEKWFTRNCDDVLGRLCTPAEKGDFIVYMLSLK